jgi:hypothetical protein
MTRRFHLRASDRPAVSVDSIKDFRHKLTPIHTDEMEGSRQQGPRAFNLCKSVCMASASLTTASVAKGKIIFAFTKLVWQRQDDG